MMGADMFLVPMLIPAIAADLQCGIPRTADIVTAFGVAYAGSSPLVTSLLLSRQTRTVLDIGLPIVVLACVTAVFADSLALLIAARVASGMGAAIVNPTVWSHLETTAAHHARGRVMLGGTAVSAAGQVVGIPLGTMLAAEGGWRLAFSGLAVGFLAVCVTTRLVLSRDGATAKPHGGARGLAGVLPLWRRPAFSLAISANIAAQAARLGVYSYVAVLLVERYAISETELGVIGIMAGTGSLAGAVFATAMVSRWCRRGRPVLGLSLCATVVLFAGIAITAAPMSFELSLLGVAISFAAGITIFGTGQFYLASTFPGDRVAVSWNSSAMYIGAAIGTFALGFTRPESAAFTMMSLTFVAVAAVSCVTAILIGDRGV